MSTKSWPFLSADEAHAQDSDIGEFTHITAVEGNDIPTSVPFPKNASEVLTICKGDEALVAKVFFEGFKLRVNALVRGPLMKEMKANAERLAKRRECSLLWASQNDKDAFMLHYTNGRDAYADQVFEKNRDAIRSKYPMCPA